MHILLVKTSSMGDVIHNMAVVADIKAHFPDAQIDWVVETPFVELVKLNPDIHRIIPVSMRRWKRALFSRQTWTEVAAFKRQLQETVYDAIIDTQALLKSALISRLAHGISHGPNYKTAREPLAGLIYNHGYAISPKIHALTRYRMLAAQALGYPLPASPPNYHLQLTKTETPPSLPERYVLGLHSTARDSKLWPVEYWITFGKYLDQRGLSLLLPWGNEVELARSNSIATGINSNAFNKAIVLPKMNLTQLASLIIGAKAAVGVDTGLMHLAVALKIPTLAIFCDTHIWQAGAMPSVDAIAYTIGGKRVCPRIEDACKTFQQILPP